MFYLLYAHLNQPNDWCLVNFQLIATCLIPSAYTNWTSVPVHDFIIRFISFPFTWIFETMPGMYFTKILYFANRKTILNRNFCTVCLIRLTSVDVLIEFECEKLRSDCNKLHRVISLLFHWNRLNWAIGNILIVFCQCYKQFQHREWAVQCDL